MTDFADHFSSHAPDYSRFRPRYPAALAAFLAVAAGGREQAWDCGTGSGQAAVVLAREFARVQATDPSAAQLAHAQPHPRVSYRLGRESDSGLPDRSADLVAAAQAAHWFELPAFYREAERVLRHGGLVAVWCYDVPTIDAEIDPHVLRFYHERVGIYWPAERHFVDARYESLPFPYERLPVPELSLTASLDRDDFLGYIGTWSAVTRFRRAEGFDPVPELAASLAAAWPDGSAPRTVRWPMNVLAGRPSIGP